MRADIRPLPAGFLEIPDRIDLVKLPSLRKTATGDVGARSLGLERHELKRLRRSIIEGLAKEFQPDLVLVDHKPTGVLPASVVNGVLA